MCDNTVVFFICTCLRVIVNILTKTCFNSFPPIVCVIKSMIDNLCLFCTIVVSEFVLFSHQETGFINNHILIICSIYDSFIRKVQTVLNHVHNLLIRIISLISLMLYHRVWCSHRLSLSQNTLCIWHIVQSICDIWKLYIELIKIVVINLIRSQSKLIYHSVNFDVNPVTDLEINKKRRECCVAFYKIKLIVSNNMDSIQRDDWNRRFFHILLFNQKEVVKVATDCML